MQRRWLMALATFALVLFTTGFLSMHVEVVEETYPAEGITTLDFEGRNGAIRFETWDQPYIWVQATTTTRALSAQAAERLASQVEIRFSRQQNTLRVEAVLPTFGNSFLHQRSIEIVVRVPQVWEGVATLRTRNGRIHATGVRGELEARTSNGRISISDHSGVLRLRTSNGRIEVTDSNAELQANTSNGRVTIERTHLHGQGWIRTSNSRIEAHIRLQPNADYELRTSNGRVNIELFEPDVQLDLRTSNRSVQVSELPIRFEESGNRHIVGTVGGGSARLAVRTSNGQVSVSEARSFR